MNNPPAPAVDAFRRLNAFEMRAFSPGSGIRDPGSGKLPSFRTNSVGTALKLQTECDAPGSGSGNNPETRTEAAEALRGLIDAIVMMPDQRELRIELKGNLAPMLGATVQSKRAPETEAFLLQVSLVAGARNQRYLQLWSGAA